MALDQATAWATLEPNGERSTITTLGRPGEEPSRAAGDIRAATALELAALAIAVDLLEGFEYEANRANLVWAGVQVDVEVERGERPRQVSRIGYQIRVTTDEAALAEIVSHRLEAHAPVFASLAEVADHDGHLVVAPTAQG